MSLMSRYIWWRSEINDTHFLLLTLDALLEKLLAMFEDYRDIQDADHYLMLQVWRGNSRFFQDGLSAMSLSDPNAEKVSHPAFSNHIWKFRKYRVARLCFCWRQCRNFVSQAILSEFGQLLCDRITIP